MKELMSERMKGEKIMKTIHEMLRNIVMTMIVCLPALVSAEQAYAVNYQNHYRGVQSPMYSEQSTTTVPTGGFQSTSAYSGQLHQDVQEPMLNADGSVNAEAYGVGQQNAPGMRKAPNGPSTPGGQLDPNAQQPLGDAVLPLMLLACAYLCMRVFLKRKRALKG